jgi:CRP/FNR family transcriptional regulator, cyclic AMP receptor protein
MSREDTLFSRFGKEFPAGSRLFQEGEAGTEMYVVQSGKVSITKSVGDTTKVLAILGPGEFFGEMSILNQKPRTATAVVVEDAKLLVIDAQTFEAMVTGNTEIALRLIKRLAKRLDSADTLISILMHKDPRARVILGLSRQAEIAGQKVDQGIFIPTSPGELGHQIGLDPAAVSEVVQTLGRSGMLAVVEGGVLVQDVPKLREFLDFLEMKQRFGET